MKLPRKAQYLLKEREFLGLGPRKRTPYGYKQAKQYTRWRTIGRFPTLEEAREELRKRFTGLFQRKITYGGITIDEG